VAPSPDSAPAEGGERLARGPHLGVERLHLGVGRRDLLTRSEPLVGDPLQALEVLLRGARPRLRRGERRACARQLRRLDHGELSALLHAIAFLEADVDDSPRDARRQLGRSIRIGDELAGQRDRLRQRF